MKKKIEINAICMIDGKFVFNKDSLAEVREFIKSHYPEEITIIFDADRSRSKSQNAFFHAAVLPAIQKALLDAGVKYVEDIEYVKQVIVKKPYLTVNEGFKDEYVRSTADLTVNEFWKFLNYCIELLLNIGGSLSPDQQQQFFKIIKDFKLESTIDEHFIKKNA